MTRKDPDARVDWAVPKVSRRGKGRPRNSEKVMVPTDGEPVPKLNNIILDPEMRAYDDAVNVRAPSLIGGVNISWLSSAFRIDVRTARKRLAGLKPVGTGNRGDEIYDFVDASSYLAPPQRDKFARWIGTLRTSDLPTQLQDQYWSSQRKKQIWEQHAGDLWKTDDVADVLGDVFKLLKSGMQLWVDNIDSKGDMPEEQRAKLTQMVDGLQNDLYQGLVNLPKISVTPSSLYDPDVITNQIRDDEDLIG